MEEEDVDPDIVVEQPAAAAAGPPPAKRKKYQVANFDRRPRTNLITPGRLPTHYVLLLDEAEQHDYIDTWGRCCLVGTVTKDNPLLISKKTCKIDLQRTNVLTFKILDFQHLHVISMPVGQPALVKIEILFFI